VPDAQSGPVIVPAEKGVTANVPRFTSPNSAAPGSGETCQIQ
jgi:hypothetical protein